MNLTDDTDDFLIKLIDAAPAAIFEISPNAARAILDDLDPNTRFYETLRDAFRDNIDCPDDPIGI